MRCENCGTELPDGARFCYMCASPVGEAAEPEVAELEAVDGGAVVVEGEDVEVVKVDAADEPAQTTGEAADAAEPVAADDVTGDEDAAADAAPAEAEPEAPGAVSAPAGQDADDDVPVAPVDFGSMPTPVKLEDPLSVGAVPFVPMAPAPRSTYVQRRVSHQPRNARPGTNSAPTTATGYNGGWPQNSAWSLQDRPAESAAPAAAGDASAENPIDNVKNKFSKALGTWTATSAARSEKKRQEKEIKEAARRVQEQERAEARDAEDRARRAAAAKAAREEKERLEREALAAAHPAAEEDAADNEPQVDVVVDAVDAVAAEPAAPASAEADQAAADITEPADADLAAAQAAVAVAAADPTLAESTAAEPEDSAEPAFPEFDDASSTAVMKPVSAPAADPAPATEQAGDTGVFSEDVSTFWLGDDVAADDEPATNDFAAASYGASGRAPYSSSRATGRNNKTLVAAVIAGLAVVLIAVGAFAAFSGSSSSKETPQLKPETEVTMPGQEETEEEAEPEEEQTVVAVKASVNDYSWSDLSKISSLISAATSRTEAMGIAQKYNLCSTTGTLDGTQAKTLTLTDGTAVNMRIVGFWQDLKSDGTGHAGISMLADSVVSVRAMNDSADGADWSATSLRSWLNGEFIDELPDELKECLVSVSKQTNRYSASAEQEATDDKVWLVSYSELVGDLGSGSYRAGSYNSEGDQYQLFSDQGVSWDAASSYLQVGGDCVNWWTRSTDTVNADRYIAPRNEDGYAGYSRNPVVSGEVGVVPGFCL